MAWATTLLTWSMAPRKLSDLQIIGCKPTAAVHFFTVFLPHSRARDLQIRQKLSSLGSLFAPTLQVRRSLIDSAL